MSSMRLRSRRRHRARGPRVPRRVALPHRSRSVPPVIEEGSPAQSAHVCRWLTVVSSQRKQDGRWCWGRRRGSGDNWARSPASSRRAASRPPTCPSSATPPPSPRARRRDVPESAPVGPVETAPRLEGAQMAHEHPWQVTAAAAGKNKNSFGSDVWVSILPQRQTMWSVRTHLQACLDPLWQLRFACDAISTRQLPRRKSLRRRQLRCLQLPRCRGLAWALAEGRRRVQ